MDYATPFPEAVLLLTMQTPAVTPALISFFAKVGLPEEIFTDQRASFRAGLMRQFCANLGIKQIFTSAYHPQTDGLVERFNQTFKTALRKLAHDKASQWDLFVDPLLFALRETPQASLGFSPFELLYGRRPQGILALVEGQWRTPTEAPALLRRNLCGN